jgi:tetratricopeptide (TPR) repeat protein
MNVRVRPVHVHANVPMVSAADADLLSVPPAVEGCRLPPGHRLDEIADRRETGQLIEMLTSPPRAGGLGRVHVVSGASGVGKSTVARSAALTLRKDDFVGSIRWISARDEWTFLDGLAALAAGLGADETEISRAREASTRHAVWQLFEKTLADSTGAARWLLVIDGADEADLFRFVVTSAQKIAAPTRLVVITTSQTGLVDSIRVELPDPDECAALLSKRLSDLGPDQIGELAPSLGRVAKHLGRLPVALHVAGTWHGSTLVRHTLPVLASRLSGLAPPSDAKADLVQRVALAVTVALEAVPGPQQRPVTVMLQLLALLAPGQPFPLSAFDAAIRQAVVDATTPEREWRPLLEGAWRTLQHTGLADLDVNGKCPTAIVHPLVAEAVRLWVTVPGGELPAGFAAAALDRVSQHLAKPPAGETATAMWRLVIPHVSYLLDTDASVHDTHLRAVLRAADAAARHLTDRGMYDQALALAQRAARRAERFADDDPDRLTARLRIALIHQGRGYYDSVSAKPGQDEENTNLLETAHAEIEAVYQAELQRCDPAGPDDRRRWLRIQHHLAAIMHDRGMLTAAELRFRAVYRDRMAAFGPDDQQAVISGHRLARVLHAVGRSKDALEILDDLLRVCERTLGEHHADTLSVLQSRAYALQAIGGQDSLRTARQEFTAVYDKRKRHLGRTHPNTLVTRHNLAWIEQASGRYNAAERQFREILAIQLRRSGRDHPHSLATAANLAWDLLQRREFYDARLLFKQVVRIRDRRLGRNHPDTQTTRGNIGWLTYEQGAFAEATTRFRKLVADREKTIGREHPRTLTTRHNLALSLRAQRNYTEAIKEFGEVLRHQQEVIGSEHESTLSTRYNLAVTYRLQGTPDDLQHAADMLEDVLGRQLKVFSSRHPAVVQTRDELMTIWRRRRDPEDLERLREERNPSRLAWALSRHRDELKYDEAPVDRAADDPLLAAFLDADIDEYLDPDDPAR